MVDHPQPAVAGLEQRDVERAAAEVVDQPDPLRLHPPAGGDGAGDGLLDERHLGEARELAGLHRGMVLGELEEGRRGDHGRRRPIAENGFGVRQQRREHLGGQLLGEERPAGGFEAEPLLGPHEPFELPPRVPRVRLQEAERPPSHQLGAATVDPHHGRRQHLALRVGHHGHGVAVEGGEDGVGGPEIDPDVHRSSISPGQMTGFYRTFRGRWEEQGRQGLQGQQGRAEKSWEPSVSLLSLLSLESLKSLLA